MPITKANTYYALNIHGWMVERAEIEENKPHFICTKECAEFTASINYSPQEALAKVSVADCSHLSAPVTSWQTEVDKSLSVQEVIEALESAIMEVQVNMGERQRDWCKNYGVSVSH